MFVPSLGVETEGKPPTSRNDLLGVVGPELKAGGSPNVSTQHVGVVGSMATHRDWILVMKIRKKKKKCTWSSRPRQVSSPQTCCLPRPFSVAAAFHTFSIAYLQPIYTIEYMKH